MDPTEFLLVKLIEELNETSQRATKALRFGLEEIQNGHTRSNGERLLDELEDVLAVYDALQTHVGMELLPSPREETHGDKVAKIYKWANYSRSRGKLKGQFNVKNPQTLLLQ